MRLKFYLMETKMKLLQYETEACKRSLSFMLDENIYLKNRLSEILKNGFDKKLLDYLEYFQTKFIKEDERIGLLRDDIAGIDKILLYTDTTYCKVVHETDKKLARLRNNILTAEKQFSELKSEFSNYLMKMFDKNIIAVS